LSGCGIVAKNANLLIVGCWVIFVAYWVVSAFSQKATAEKSSWLSSLSYRVPLALGGFLLWFPAFHSPLNLVLIPGTDWARVCGVIFCVIGLLLTSWSRRTLGANWSSEVAFKQGHELVQRGPYRFVRHPIYTGILLMSLGTAIVVGQLHSWLGFPFLCGGFWIKLRQEEAVMQQHFPDEYPAYQRQVRALVPFLV
jgi:protein-S-isoprenylcysteine O-methyltransferase Ste14